MITRLVRKTALLGSVLLVSMSMVGQTAWAEKAGPPGRHLNITEVFVDFGTDTITITGEHLDHGPGPLVVTLGDANNIGDISGDCTPDFASDPQTIVCDLSSSSGLPPDGDYLLTVTSGIGQSQNDEYDLTIARVGPLAGPSLCPCPFGVLLPPAPNLVQTTWLDGDVVQTYCSGIPPEPGPCLPTREGCDVSETGGSLDAIGVASSGFFDEVGTSGVTASCEIFRDGVAVYRVLLITPAQAFDCAKDINAYVVALEANGVQVDPQEACRTE